MKKSKVKEVIINIVVGAAILNTLCLAYAIAKMPAEHALTGLSLWALFSVVYAVSKD